MDESRDDIKIEFNVEKFKGLSDEEISDRFNKHVLPAVLKQIRERRASDCPVCNPWSYAVF